MSVPLVVGMPVHRRAAALEAWFDSLAAQDRPDRTRLLFLLSEEGDPTERVIARRAPDAEVLYDPRPGGEGFEDPDRYGLLASLRNRLLRLAQGLDADRYLSWDSDIVLEPGALRALLDSAGGPDEPEVLGALVDMGGQAQPGYWSWMTLSGNDAFRRRDLGPDGLPPHEYDLAPFEVGVVMGVKLLSRHAYRTARYGEHLLGEDVGFALNCERVGIRRWLVPGARGEHRVGGPVAAP